MYTLCFYFFLQFHLAKKIVISGDAASKILKNKKSTLVLKDTAEAIWGRDTLAMKSVTGTVAPRKKSHGEAPKDPLTPEKVAVVAGKYTEENQLLLLLETSTLFIGYQKMKWMTQLLSSLCLVYCCGCHYCVPTFWFTFHSHGQALGCENGRRCTEDIGEHEPPPDRENSGCPKIQAANGPIKHGRRDICVLWYILWPVAAWLLLWSLPASTGPSSNWNQ